MDGTKRRPDRPPLCGLAGLGLGLFWLAGPRELVGFWSAVAAWVVLETATRILPEEARSAS